eukprot:scaffold3.g6411.t1
MSGAGSDGSPKAAEQGPTSDFVLATLPASVRVQCGSAVGTLLLHWGEEVAVECGGKRLAGNEFEAEGGRASAKKWKTSTRVVGEGSGGTVLADWLQARGVDIVGGRVQVVRKKTPERSQPRRQAAPTDLREAPLVGRPAIVGQQELQQPEQRRGQEPRQQPGQQQQQMSSAEQRQAAPNDLREAPVGGPLPPLKQDGGAKQHTKKPPAPKPQQGQEQGQQRARPQAQKSGGSGDRTASQQQQQQRQQGLPSPGYISLEAMQAHLQGVFIGYQPGDPTLGPLPGALPPPSAAGAGPGGAAPKLVMLKEWSQERLMAEAAATIDGFDPYGSVFPQPPALPTERQAFITGQQP